MDTVFRRFLSAFFNLKSDLSLFEKDPLTANFSATDNINDSMKVPVSIFSTKGYHKVLWRIYKGHTMSFQTFFVWALLLIVHTWNSSPLQSNLLWLQCTCCSVPTTSGRPHGSPLVSACQWPSSQPLSSPQLSHNDSQ